jgi:GNAT superfamily N-acetyltransferase
MLQIIVADLSKPAHAEVLVFLLNEYAQDAMGGGAELSQFVKENLASELQKRSGAHVIFALLENVPVGLAICFEGFSTFACQPLLNIHDVVVLAGHRGHGIAKQLLQKAEEIARKNHCCKLTLEVLEGNIAAQSVYKACGYAGYELNPTTGKALFWQKKL